MGFKDKSPRTGRPSFWKTVSRVFNKKQARQIAHEYTVDGYSTRVIRWFGAWLVQTHSYKGRKYYTPPWRR